MTREDYRNRVIGKLANLSTNLNTVITTSEINSAFLDALRNLPYKGVYKEEKWYKTLSTSQKEYSLEGEFLKVEKVEFDLGTGSDREEWEKQQGWEEFAGSLHLATYPTSAHTVRVWVKKKFTEIEDDDTTVDVPDDKGEVLVLGIVRRLLDNIIHYMIDANNYDSVAKPTGVTLPQVKNWRDEIRVEEERIIKSFQTTPRPRFMDLVN